MKDPPDDTAVGEVPAHLGSTDAGGQDCRFVGRRAHPEIGEEAGAELRYNGPEGNLTFDGPQISRVDSTLGAQLSVVLRPNADTGGTTLTVLVPRVFGLGAEPVVSRPWLSRRPAAASSTARASLRPTT